MLVLDNPCPEGESHKEPFGPTAGKKPNSEPRRRPVLLTTCYQDDEDDEDEDADEDEEDGYCYYYYYHYCYYYCL